MNLDINITGKFQQLSKHFSDELAYKYWFFGYNMRSLQLIEIKFQLTDVIKKSGGNNLNPYETTNLNILLNAYYLNLLGALDNLAWVLQHEFNIIEGASEKNNKRNKIGIFLKDFKNKLKIKDNELYKELNTYQSWFDEIKMFRDPAAHRIPLYCAPGVRTETHTKPFHDAQNKFLKQDYKTDRDSYMEAQTELHNIGTFQPIFTLFSESDSPQIFNIKRTIESDYQPFWEISNLVFKHIEKNILIKHT